MKKHEKELRGLFAKYSVPLSGVHDYEQCHNDCCYPEGKTQERLIAALRAYDKKHRTEFSKYAAVGDISSVNELLRGETIRACRHVWRSAGHPSMTTSGVRERFLCGECGSEKYGPASPRSSNGFGWPPSPLGVPFP